MFIVIPEDITPNLPDPVTFRVVATSDPDTPITYTWYHYVKQSACENNWCTVFNVANKTHITHDNGSTLTIFQTEVADLGTYRCVASNDVSQDIVDMKLLTPPDLDLRTCMFYITQFNHSSAIDESKLYL